MMEIPVGELTAWRPDSVAFFRISAFYGNASHRLLSWCRCGCRLGLSIVVTLVVAPLLARYATCR